MILTYERVEFDNFHKNLDTFKMTEGWKLFFSIVRRCDETLSDVLRLYTFFESYFPLDL